MALPMYNKLFAKILDSSIWLESDTTRIVWFTLLAAMDQDGFAQFASIPNLAHRARVGMDATEAAVKCLEGTDEHSSDPDNEGRRIEKVPGGWMVLNSEKYQKIVTRQIAREKGRERVAKHRAKKRGNAPVTVANGSVTPSDAETDAHEEKNSDFSREGKGASRQRSFCPRFEYPLSDFDMYRKLEELGIETAEGNDGNFFNQMEANGWTTGKGDPIYDWPATYRARLEAMNAPF